MNLIFTKAILMKRIFIKTFILPSTFLSSSSFCKQVVFKGYKMHKRNNKVRRRTCSNDWLCGGRESLRFARTINKIASENRKNICSSHTNIDIQMNLLFTVNRKNDYANDKSIFSPNTKYNVLKFIPSRSS